MDILEKYESLGLTKHKDYYLQRKAFVQWAVSERYTLDKIGSLLGLTKQGVRKILSKDKEVIHTPELT